jgi:hypothetical protein
MTYDDRRTMQARARLAGFLFLFVNALYIASLLAGVAGPDEIRRPAVALQACASAATIAMAWSFYALLKPAGQGLALMALLFRVAEAALYGVVAIFSLLLLGDGAAGPPGLDSALPALARGARFATGQVATLYFCAGSALFFYLLLKGRFIPRAAAALGLVATFVTLASALVQIGAPAFAGHLAFNGPLLLFAESVTGVWLLVVGVGPRRLPPADPAPSARRALEGAVERRSF